MVVQYLRSLIVLSLCILTQVLNGAGSAEILAFRTAIGREDHTRALTLLEKMIEEEKNVTKKVSYYLKASELSLKVGDRENALVWLDRLSEVDARYILQQNHQALIAIYASLSQQLLERGEYERSARFASKALSLIAQSYGEKNRTSAILYNILGAAELENMHVKRSWEASRKAYDYFYAYGMRQEALKSKMNMGTVKMKEGDYEEALDVQNEVLQEAKQINMPEAFIASLHYIIGVTYMKSNSLESANVHLQKAMQWYKKRQGKSMVKTSLALFRLQLALHDLPRARSYLSLAYEAYGHLVQPPKVLEGLVFQSYADYYVELGAYEKALEYAKKARSCISSKHLEYAYIDATISDIYADLGLFDQARKYMDDSLKIKETLLSKEHPDLVYSYLKLSNILGEMGEYDKALCYAKKGLDVLQKTKTDMLEPLYIWTYGNLASLYLKKQEVKQAYDSALESMAHFFAYEKAYFGISDTIQKLGIKTAHDGLFSLLSITAFAYINSDDKVEEEAVFERLFLIWSRYKHMVNGSFDTLSLLYQRASIKERKVIDHFRDLRKQYDRYWQQQERSSERLKYLQEQMHQQSIAVAALMKRYHLASPKIPKDIEGFLAHLPKESAYIDFAYVEKNYLRFILSHKRGVEVKYYDAHTTEAVEEDIGSIRQMQKKIAKGERFADIFEAKRSYGALYRKLFPEGVPQTDSLLISPDGILAFLPFEALYDGKSYLVEHHTLYYLASAKDMLATLSKTSSKSQTYVVFDDPDYSDADLSYRSLQGTRKEADAIGELFGDLKRFSQDKATAEALLKQRHPRFLHIGAHGYFTPAKDRYRLRDVGIVLAKGKKVSGVSLAGMNLYGTELVTLSCCESALGKIERGEGVLGLYEAFFQAGARRVVVSLWQVNDTIAAKAMALFYTNVHDGTGYALSLAKMKRKLIEQGVSHPYYWASFILYQKGVVQ